jgi:hypothetical protein
MLGVSLVLHGGAWAGFALSGVHGHSAQVASEAEMPALVLSSEEMPAQPLPKRQLAVQPSAVSVPVATTLPVPVATKVIAHAAATPSASLALETNPNAHVRALPPEVALSPTPAPHLNGRDGVVFLLDISGSMYEPCAGSTRLEMAREVLSDRIRALKDGTPFAITVYAQTARNSGPLVAANSVTRDAAIRFIKEDIDCGGGTDLPAGLASAMTLATGNLVLVTDGDLNTTLAELMGKARSILVPDAHGPRLTVVGISPRPRTDADAMLKSLANLTGGRYVVQQTNEVTPVLTAQTATTP